MIPGGYIFSLTPDFSPVPEASPDAFFNRFNGFFLLIFYLLSSFFSLSRNSQLKNFVAK